jgi:hypothetical protein
MESAILDAGFLNTTIFEQSIIDGLELDDFDDASAQKKTLLI